MVKCAPTYYSAKPNGFKRKEGRETSQQGTEIYPDTPPCLLIAQYKFKCPETKVIIYREPFQLKIFLHFIT